MNASLKNRIAELRQMTVHQLRRQHLELFGEPNNSGHRDYLFRRIAWRLQAQAEGDVAERARRIRTRAAELAHDADVRTTPPKDAMPQTGPTRAKRRHVDPRLPAPGTVLARTFKGHTYQVRVKANGFEMDGKFYKSLSAAAKAITGSHWNGPLFFGLGQHKENDKV